VAGLEKHSWAGQDKAKDRKCDSKPYIPLVNSEPYTKYNSDMPIHI
jgi:hypothetical protein